MSRALLAVFLVALSGCQTKPINELTYTELVALADEVDARCAEQGAGPGAPDYRACFQQEANREVAMRQRNRETQRAIGQAIAEIGNQPRPVQTTCNTFGTMTNCTSF